MGCEMLRRTGADIASEIMMVCLNSKGPFLIVEGPSDERFLASRVFSDCYIAIGSGRTTVEAAVRQLEDTAQQFKFLGIIDEDYDWLTGTVVNLKNVVKTDPRDLEGILFRSNAVKAVLAEFGDRGRIAAYEAATGRSILDTVLTYAEFFGRIRMVNALGPNICLKKYRPVRFYVKGGNWAYDLDLAKKVAVDLGVADSVRDLEQKIAKLPKPSVWHCVRGHDLVEILVGGLICSIGNGACETVAIERVLRQAFSKSEFQETQLYCGLRTWSDTEKVEFLS